MSDQNEMMSFNQAVLPHLDAAYNLARWLARKDHDAEDIVQEAYLRAFKHWKSLSGRDCRSLLLKDIRNTFYSRLRQQSVEPVLKEDGETDDIANNLPGPKSALIQNVGPATLRAALEDLVVEFREVIVLRELEGLTYKEIAGITDVPIGTVISRLARGRKQLQSDLAKAASENCL